MPDLIFNSLSASHSPRYDIHGAHIPDDAETTTVAALDELGRLRLALGLIADGGKCERYYGTYNCTTAGRSPYAVYGDDRWCDACIARTALDGTPLPAWGTSGVEEMPQADYQALVGAR